MLRLPAFVFVSPLALLSSFVGATITVIEGLCDGLVPQPSQFDHELLILFELLGYHSLEATPLLGRMRALVSAPLFCSSGILSSSCLHITVVFKCMGTMNGRVPWRLHSFLSCHEDIRGGVEHAIRRSVVESRIGCFGGLGRRDHLILLRRVDLGIRPI